MRIRVEEGDITVLRVDAIVNAANEHLTHGGGVAAAISRAAGPTLDAESRDWVRMHGPVLPGTAAVTSGGRLPSRWVVHVVGPRYRPDQANADLLAEAVGAALDAAGALGARTVGVPAISAGIYGYPKAEAARVIAEAVVSWTVSHPGALDEIVLVAFDRDIAASFRSALT